MKIFLSDLIIEFKPGMLWAFSDARFSRSLELNNTCIFINRTTVYKRIGILNSILKYRKSLIASVSSGLVSTTAAQMSIVIAYQFD